jgi:precorrin-3B methylase
MKYESWFIENPISKDLTKRITLKLGPRAEQDFIIVIKSPQSKRREDMLSMVNVGLLTYKNEQFGVKTSFE